jgi:hypothetical protein
MRSAIIIGFAAVLMVGISAGCFDSASPAIAPPGSVGTSSTLNQSNDLLQLPRWTIRYEVGSPGPNQRQLPACPANVACHDLILKGWTSGSGRPIWARVVTYHVTCPAGPGDDTPPAGCGALATLRGILRTHAAGFCSCPPPAGLQGEARLRRGGRTIVVPLTFCPYCGHRGADKADAALRVLTPHAA